VALEGGAVMHLPQHHPFERSSRISFMDVTNLMMILLGLFLTLWFYPMAQ
jgi:hypothetical protein